MNGSSAAAHSAIRAANSAEEPSRPRAISGHCEPCPGKVKTRRPPVAVPVTTGAAGRPSASAARPAPLSAPRITARCSKVARVRVSERATSPGSAAGVWSMTARSRRACARSDCSERADSIHGTSGTAGVAGWLLRAPWAGPTGGLAGGALRAGVAGWLLRAPWAGPTGGLAGGALSTRWQLVPPMPNELTPATGGRPGAGHGQPSVTTRSRSSSRGIAGLGAAKCRLAGSWPREMLSATFSSPAMPAAPSRWPMLVFTEPTSSGCSGDRSRPSAAPSAAASTGSPARVPVPCSSTYWTSAGRTPARAQACRMTCSWARLLGAVSPSPPPSLFTAPPRITLCTTSPSRNAADSGLSTTRAPPSPRTYPLAAASKTRQRPSGDSAPKLPIAAVVSASRLRFTPPASARLLSPRRRLSQASCTATSDDDCPVSRVRLGPRRPRT